MGSGTGRGRTYAAMASNMARLTILFLRVVPRRWLGRATGVLVHARRPAFLAAMLRDLLIRLLGIDTTEAEKPPAAYPGFGAYFTRALKEGARPLAGSRLVWPSDGRLDGGGRIETGRLIQAKGLRYTAGALLQDDASARLFEGGAFLTVYLSPRDCHRVHWPVSGAAIRSRFVCGELWPVNRAGVMRIPELFCINERWIVLAETEQGLVGVVMVAATNVGCIEPGPWMQDAPDYMANGLPLRDFHPPVPVEKGSLLGTFHMGSTVILLLSETATSCLPVLPETGMVRCRSAIV